MHKSSSLLSIYSKTPDNVSLCIYTYKIHLPHILVFNHNNNKKEHIHLTLIFLIGNTEKKKKGLYSQHLQHKLCNSLSWCTTDWDISLPTCMFFNETEKIFSLIKIPASEIKGE